MIKIYLMYMVSIIKNVLLINNINMFETIFDLKDIYSMQFKHLKMNEIDDINTIIFKKIKYCKIYYSKWIYSFDEEYIKK